MVLPQPWKQSNLLSGTTSRADDLADKYDIKVVLLLIFDNLLHEQNIITSTQQYIPSTGQPQLSFWLSGHLLDVYHFLCSVISSRRFCSYDWPQFHYYYKRQITFVRRISWKKIHAIFNDSIIIALAIRSDLLLGQNHLLIDFIKKLISQKVY